AIVASLLTAEERPVGQAVSSDCPRGTRNGPNGCVAVQIPPNAELDVFGHDWTCKQGFKPVSRTCAAMSPEEFRESERVRAEVARRVRADLSACEIDGEPVRGERAEVVIKKSGCGDYFVADGPSGHYLLEWYGGHSPATGDVIIGQINSYGFKDVCYH